MSDGRGLAWRDRARARLEPLIAEVDCGRTTLGWFDIERLLDGRDSSDGFRWSAVFMRRTIGLPALQELAAATHDGRRLTPLEAVTRVVDRMVAVGRDGWADREGAEPEDWLSSVGEGGRAAATRDAVTWVTACRTQLTWPPRDIRARGEGTSVRDGAQGRALALDAHRSRLVEATGRHRARRTDRSHARQPRLHRPRAHDGRRSASRVGHGCASRLGRSHAGHLNR